MTVEPLISKSDAFTLLGHLWLHEPDAEHMHQATQQFGMPSATVGELAQAYADLFLLNVPPYGSTFTDERGELSGYSAHVAQNAYDVLGFAPRELLDVAGADHMGLCLSLIGWMRRPHGESKELYKLKESDLAVFGTDFRFWAPSCCIAVEREPFVHPFYLSLASRTRELLHESDRLTWMEGANAAGSISALPPGLHEAEQASLNEIVAYFLTPARSGAFLSRACLGQIGSALGFRLPFGPRFDVARNLFVSAGESRKLDDLLAVLHREFDAWASMLRANEAERPVVNSGPLMSDRARESVRTIETLRKSAATLEFA